MEILRLNQISPDQIILWQWWFVKINATMIFTWLIMALLLFFSWLATHRLSTDIHITRWQNLLEVIVSTIRDQIKEISQDNPDHYLAFIGTLFLFIGLSNLLAVIPGYVAPTSSLTTTAALAICVFIAVPLYGITKRGLLAYLKEYFQPTFIFFPFHVMGDQALREHHEPRQGDRHPARRHPALLSHCHECPGSVDRHGAGIYLRNPRHGVYRLGNTGARAGDTQRKALGLR